VDAHAGIDAGIDAGTDDGGSGAVGFGAPWAGPERASFRRDGITGHLPTLLGVIEGESDSLNSAHRRLPAWRPFWSTIPVPPFALRSSQAECQSGQRATPPEHRQSACHA